MKAVHKKIKHHLKCFRLYLGKLILDKAPTRVWHQAQLPTSKILFIRHDGKIGDFLVSSFIYREIKKQTPQVHIGVVVASETETLFESNPYIDSLYVTSKRALLPFWRVGRQIRKEKYDIVIDLTDVLRNRDIILIRAINAAINIGYNKEHFKLFNRNVESNHEHITLDYCKALACIGYHNIDPQSFLPTLTVSTSLKTFYQNELSDKEYIAINFFGAANHKKFSAENRLKWLDKLRLSYPDKILLVLTYPQVTEELKAQLPDGTYKIYDETTTIFDSIELMRNACLVISPDTAIVHAAAALNKPLITFYMTPDQNNPYRKWFPAHINKQDVDIFYYRHNINEIDIDDIKLRKI